MNDHDELTRALGRELHARVDGLHDAPIGLGDVQARAGRIRRHRRLAAGAAVAAAVAILVPAAMLADLGTHRAGGPPGPVTRGPDAPATHTVLTLDGLARGDEPGVEYFTADGVVLPGEGLVEQTTNWQALVPSAADGGWLAYGPARDEVRYLTEEFGPQGGSSAGGAFVATADRSYVAWTAPEAGRQTLLLHSTTDAGRDRSWEFPEHPSVEPVGILGDGRVVFETTDRGGDVTVGIAEPDGSTSGFADVLDAVAVSPDGLVSVLTRLEGDFGACFGIVDTAVDATEVAWETCDHSLGVFSPDARYVLAGPAYLDGAGDGSMSILDARTHRTVATFERPSDGQVTLGQEAWESDTAVLAHASDGAREALLRLGVDGTLELATDVRERRPVDDVLFWLGDDRVRH